MTSDEQLFIASPLLELSERQRVNVSWLMEGATCIVWALGYTASLPPFDTQAELDLLKSIPAETANSLGAAARLRPAQEIDATRAHCRGLLVRHGRLRRYCRVGFA
jgi:hypothetical protein